MAAESRDHEQPAPARPKYEMRNRSVRASCSTAGAAKDEDDDNSSSSSDADSDGEDEPKLKYTRLTGSLAPVYRNGDATSTFLVAGDKMVGPIMRAGAAMYRRVCAEL